MNNDSEAFFKIDPKVFHGMATDLNLIEHIFHLLKAKLKTECPHEQAGSEDRGRPSAGRNPGFGDVYGFQTATIRGL